MQGSILPGCSKHFTFTFVSHASGTYVEDWEISSLPAVPATQHRVTLRGVSVVDDLDTGDAMLLLIPVLNAIVLPSRNTCLQLNAATWLSGLRAKRCCTR